MSAVRSWRSNFLRSSSGPMGALITSVQPARASCCSTILALFTVAIRYICSISAVELDAFAFFLLECSRATDRPAVGDHTVSAVSRAAFFCVSIARANAEIAEK